MRIICTNLEFKRTILALEIEFKSSVFFLMVDRVYKFLALEKEYSCTKPLRGINSFLVKDHIPWRANAYFEMLHGRQLLENRNKKR